MQWSRIITSEILALSAYFQDMSRETLSVANKTPAPFPPIGIFEERFRSSDLRCLSWSVSRWFGQPCEPLTPAM
jgi:hypothetical protein